MPIRVAAVQLAGSTDDDAWDLTALVTAIEAAARAGAQLIVLPELSTTPYFCGGDAAAYEKWARPVTAPEVRTITALTERLDVTVVLPFFESDHDGAHHNAAVVLERGHISLGWDAAGIGHDVDEKVHLPISTEPPPGFNEAAHFTPGHSLNVHRLDASAPGLGQLVLGTLICYDRRFAESWRMMRALGADIVAVPVAGAGTDPSGFFVAELRTHARENGVYVIAASKVDDDLVAQVAVPNLGESCIVSPEGVVLGYRSADQGPGIVYADLDIEALLHVRREIGLFDERRLDIVGEGPQHTAAARRAALQHVNTSETLGVQ